MDFSYHTFKSLSYWQHAAARDGDLLSSIALPESSVA